jgi:hypothetical protein
MADLGGGTMAANEVFTATVEIPPGTRETTMVFYKQDASGSLRLNNPSGFEASMGDRSVSSVVETPHAVIWSLVDPVPGAWTVDVKGVQGALSSWQYTQNKYSPALASHSAIPVDLPASIIAYVAEGGRKVTVEGVELAATVTTPGGSVITHRLHDDGVAGDSVAGDGYYSASMPPVGKTGDYVVDLALSWAGSNVAVISRTGFAAQYFPTVEVTPVQLVDIRPGEKVRVASALVHVQGEPYAIAPGTMTPVLSSDAESLGILEVTPRQVLEQNRAWEYDVYFTPGVEALHTLTFDLSVQYLGREYTFTTPSVVLSSIMPVIPAAPEPVAVVEPEPVVEAPAVTVITPVPFPVVPVTIGAATVVLLALAIAIYWLSRTRPYGYLYNDRNELIVDFSQIQRSAARLLFARSKVSGVELGAQGLERVTFRFDGGSVELNSPQVTPTIRVNNQPLIGDAPIHDRTWIGAHGKLYSFLVRPLMSPEPQPAAGDD